MKKLDIEKYPEEIRELLRLNGMGVEHAQWLGDAQSSIGFLGQNAKSPRVVIYANMKYVLVHCVLALAGQIKKAGHQDLGHGFVTPDRTWCIQHVSGGGKPDQVYLEGPLDSVSDAVKGGEKLIFRRSWPGQEESPLELSQKLVHALDLHWVENRKAYCRIDASGDIEDVINVFDVDSGQEYPGLVVTIRSQEIFEFAKLSDMLLYFFFDFTRTGNNFNGWGVDGHFSSRTREFFYNGQQSPAQGSYINGRQIVRPPVTLQSIVRRRQELRSPRKPKYAQFQAQCRRTGRVITASCNPDRLTSYFENDTKKLLQITPAFFRAEVLSKYKADPSKYELMSRTINCRGAWSLRTFDINDQGQVHTYLRYLGELPYAEQLYWQSFNEKPRGGLSKRAIQTDLMGEWSDFDDPVESVKNLARQLDAKPPEWWQPRGEDATRILHLPITTSEAEWSEAILVMDQLLVEGFPIASLRKIVTAAGRTFQPEWKPLKLIEECLCGLHVGLEDAKEMVGPLRRLHDLRSIVKGHATGGKKKAAIQDALRLGSLRAHFEILADDCEKAMHAIVTRLPPSSPTSVIESP